MKLNKSVYRVRFSYGTKGGPKFPNTAYIFADGPDQIIRMIDANYGSGYKPYDEPYIATIEYIRLLSDNQTQVWVLDN